MSITEENLIPVEGIIKAGQRLVKIGETFIPIGFGGNFEPGAISFKEEGRDTYYKCASVSETTWDGYALVLGADGYYTISETLTTGLTYGIGYTPKVDGVYNANATISVGKYNKLVVIPEEGLIFHASLSSASSTAETGQALVTTGTVTYETINGIPCATMGSDSSQKITSTFTLSETGSYSVSAYVSEITSGDGYPFAIGGSGSGKRLSLYSAVSSEWFYSVGGDTPISYSKTNPTGWKHVCLTYDEPTTTCKMYIDGVLIGTGSCDVNITEGNCFIFARPDGYYSALEGTSIAGFRVYNRVLTDDEVLALSEEFTPTV